MFTPNDFLLGAAISAHQVEGNNAHNDYWHYEQLGRFPASGSSADHYNLYEKDFALAKEMGLNAMRISIEWSRIEPAEGQINAEAIEHYKNMLKSLGSFEMKTFVTLFHYTLPKWLADQGGFESKAAASALARFASLAAREFGELVDFWIMINEPQVYAFGGYWHANRPPFKHNIFKTFAVLKNLINAHKAGYAAIKSVLPNAKVGIAKEVAFYQSATGGFVAYLFVRAVSFVANHLFTKKLLSQLDFIGLNYYFSFLLQFSWLRGYKVINQTRPHTDMGAYTYPKGIYNVLNEFKKYNLPLYITENGIANANAEMQQRFIKEHLSWALKARDQGIDLRGYFYWSLIDTYEFQDGYNRKFGLIEVDYGNLERKMRPCCQFFKDLAQNNG